MKFLIADTFTDSLARLTGDEQKAVKTTAFDLQLNPANPGMKLHRVDRARDKDFWSVRVNRDIRLIVHRSKTSLLLCYVDHHDEAYRWAEQRRLERHPKTGAAQFVEIVERVREIEVPRFVDSPQIPQAHSEPKLFQDVEDDELLEYGVPPEWISEVREVTEATVFNILDHLPAEASEALLELATGGKPEPPMQLLLAEDAFAHPDAKRRFRVLENVEELERALEFPWEKWAIFLHPSQRELVEREYGGPARVAGSAGTGKTVVALHRAVHLARANPEARGLLATFSEPLAASLRTKLRRLVWKEPRIAERLEVESIHGLARRLYRANVGHPKLVSTDALKRRLEQAAEQSEGLRFSAPFLWSEWDQVVDAWQLETWSDYRDVPRLGRRTRLGEKQRTALWQIFSEVRAWLEEQDELTMPMLFRRLEKHLAAATHRPFEFVVIDEAQDLGVPELRFLARLVNESPDRLFFAGDLGQRIFQTPFSWLQLGVDVRGRSHTLRVNYRTSHQIRETADRLLDPEIRDVDGIEESRRGTISVFDGPRPTVRLLDSEEEEARVVAEWLEARIEEGVAPSEIGLIVRSKDELERAKAAAAKAGLEVRGLLESGGKQSETVPVGTMHEAKGLEFRAVAVMACDDEVVPLQSRIESIAEEADLEDAYNTERHLLYVACTRARDHLLVTGVAPGSEFLEDLAIGG